MTKRSLLLFSTVFSTMFSGAFYQAAALTGGYILSANYGGSKTELFDKDGIVVYTWNHLDPDDEYTALSGYACYLLENGNLMRSCSPSNIETATNAVPPNGAFQEIDLNGVVVWADTIADMDQVTHHDFKVLPNGNILAVAFVTTLKEDAIKAGLDTLLFKSSGGIFGGSLTSILTEKIIEIKPDRTGGGNNEIVWEWYALDHITPTNLASTRPDRFAGYAAPPFSGQMMHLNGIDFNAKKNLIVFSSRVFSEVFVIDHSTTTEQAIGSTGGTYGKGGDILYRWGHPSNYIVQFRDTMIITKRSSRLDTTSRYDTSYQRIKIGHPNDLIYTLHCPTWIPEGYPGAGNIMMFHNNSNSGMAQLGFSQVVEINPWDATGALNKLVADAPSEPLKPTWIYLPLDSMYSTSMSSALRIKNGNTIVHEAYPGGNGSGKGSSIREVDPSGQIVGSKISLAKVSTYNPAKIMYYPDDYPGIIKVLEKASAGIHSTDGLNGNRLNRIGVVRIAGHIKFSNVTNADISVYSLHGAKIASIHPSAAICRWSTASLPAGTYMVKVRTVDGRVADRVVSVVR